MRRGRRVVSAPGGRWAIKSIACARLQQPVPRRRYVVDGFRRLWYCCCLSCYALSCWYSSSLCRLRGRRVFACWRRRRLSHWLVRVSAGGSSGRYMYFGIKHVLGERREEKKNRRKDRSLIEVMYFSSTTFIHENSNNDMQVSSSLSSHMSLSCHLPINRHSKSRYQD